MRIPIVLLCLFFTCSLHAQLVVDRTSHDFGQIALFNNDTAWFNIRNNGLKTVYLLPTPPDPTYAVLTDSRQLEPEESMRIAIVYYTDNKGRFNLQAPVYFSSEKDPILFTIKGTIKSIHENAFNTCPSIENSKPLKPAQIPLKVTVRDAETNERLTGVKADAKYRNSVMHCVPGYESVALKCNVPYGPLVITASKNGYFTEEIYYTYTDQNYHCEIFLKPMRDTVKLAQKEITKQNEDRTIRQQADTVPIATKPFYTPAVFGDTGLSEQLHKPNHLVFIVDVSGSMKDSTKLGYLKPAMKRLISEIRPGDHITLITYASKVKVVFENYSGSDKARIYEALDTLTAAGGSNGSQSLVKAYELAELYFILNGNNQIFLATDGLLNSSKITNEDLYRIADRNWRKSGIKLSGICFGDNEAAIQFMKKLSGKGRGHFIQIQNKENDINNLLEEVKTQSKR